VLLVHLGFEARNARGGAKLMARNFYGVLRVTDGDEVRTLTHGIVNHGEQFLDAARRRQPTTYYGPPSGIGLALVRSGRPQRQRVGVIGLGAGVLAAYGREGDTYRFYEINPLAVEIARRDFYFLRDCPAQVDVGVGDGRLQLEREPDEKFDVLAVDAFSGDAIPMHLLTKEAFALYFRHLRPGGVLALHLTNQYLDLVPVAALSARALGKEARLVDNPGDTEEELFHTLWVLAPERREWFQDPVIEKAARAILAPTKLRLWTDNYSNLFEVMR
jgi:SAM-dependent methyltransferase